MPADPRDLRRQLNSLAYTQAGYFTAAQALKLGYTYPVQRYHVGAGNWVRVDRGVFRLAGWPAEPEDEYVLWRVWSRNLGVMSHDSALYVHGLSDLVPTKTHLTVPPPFRKVNPLVQVHLGTLGQGEVEQRRGWQVTAPLRTITDVADSLISQEHIDRAVADALERGSVSRRSLVGASYSASERAALRIERALGRMADKG
jgi:predicted transcriptional regulator of viral defense system